VRLTVWTLGGALLFGAVLYPSLMLLTSSVRSGDRLTGRHLATVASDPDALRVTWNSLYVAGLAAAGATALGGCLAWLVVRTDLPGRGWLRSALLIPYLVPPFLGGIAWLHLLGPTGYVNQVLMALLGRDEPLFRIYGPVGVTLVMALYGYPMALLVIAGTLEQIEPSLEEAARAAGAGRWRSLRDITLPLAAPGIVAAAGLTFLSSIANFGIPAVLGFPAKFFVLTTKIYATIVDFDVPHHLHLASAYSLVLVAIAVVLLALQRRLLGRWDFTVVTGRGGATAPAPLGRWRRPAAVLLWGFCGLVAAAPLVAVLLAALTRAYGLPPTWRNLTGRSFGVILFQLPLVWRALANSAFLAFVGASLVVLLGAALAHFEVRRPTRALAVVEALVAIPYAVPGTVVALAMILAFLKPLPLLGLQLYNTLWILLLAYVARFLILGTKPIAAALAQIDASLEEAARSAGATALRTFRDVTWPLARPAVVAGWFLVAIPAMSELTLSILLYSAGNETVGVTAFNLHEEGQVALAAGLAVVIIVATLAGNALARALSGGRVGF
jgi:iron(III) transport system permease protein